MLENEWVCAIRRYLGADWDGGGGGVDVCSVRWGVRHIKGAPTNDLVVYNSAKKVLIKHFE